MSVSSIEAFEKLLRFFTYMASAGGVLIVLGVVLGIALRPNGWGWTAALGVAGALSLGVGLRERSRGRKVLVRLRTPNQIADGDM